MSDKYLRVKAKDLEHLLKYYIPPKITDCKCPVDPLPCPSPEAEAELIKTAKEMTNCHVQFMEAKLTKALLKLALARYEREKGE